MDKIQEFISEEILRQEIQRVANEISRDYRNEDVVLICVLKGAILFLSDLMKRIDSTTVTIDFIGLSSYEGGTKSTGVVKLTSDLSQPIEGKHVIIVEDIVDSGLTLQFLTENLKLRNPLSIAICSLLVKPSNLKVPLKINYKCFEIPDKFVVGYGMDYDERLRNLPYVGIMEPGKKS